MLIIEIFVGNFIFSLCVVFELLTSFELICLYFTCNSLIENQKIKIPRQPRSLAQERKKCNWEDIYLYI